MERLRCKNFLFAILVVVILVPQSYSRPQSEAEIEEMKKALFNTCNAKFEITDDIKASIKSGSIPEDRNFKCFVMCFMEELALMDEIGVIDGDSMIAMATTESMKPITEEIVKNCLKDITGKPDRCDVAFDFVSCGYKINTKIIEMVPF